MIALDSYSAYFAVSLFFCATEIQLFFNFSRWRPPPSWIFEISSFNGRYAQERRTVSSCQISSKSLKPRLRYCYISIFQDGCRRHLGFLKFQNFNRRNGQEGATASACQISSKSVEPRPRYGVFSIFQKGGSLPIWILKSSNF